MKIKEWEKIHHANVIQKKARVAILLSDKVDFRVNKFIRDRKRHYITIKEQEDRNHKCVHTQQQSWQLCEEKLIELNWKIDKSTIVVG